MRILAVGDIHGNFKEVLPLVLDNTSKYDHVVFLGDYVDSFIKEQNGLEAIQGFKRLCELSKEHSWDILLGNHDFQYISPRNSCTGRHLEFSYAYYEMFSEAQREGILKVGVQYGNTVFSHAGFSKPWKDTIENYLSNFLEGFLFQKLSIKKEAFEKLSFIEKINICFKHNICDFLDYYPGDFSGYGECAYQCPLWIRPTSLWENMAYDSQVVGHTEIDEKFENKRKNMRLHVVDSNSHCTLRDIEIL